MMLFQYKLPSTLAGWVDLFVRGFISDIRESHAMLMEQFRDARERLQIRRARPDSIPTWLDIATGGLEEDAQARVRAEILAHCHEAIQAGVEEGLSPTEAHAQALAGLGSPQAARREFERVHFTRHQARSLRVFEKPENRARILLVMMLWMPIGLMMIFKDPLFGVCGTIFMSYMLSMPVVQWWRWGKKRWIILGHLLIALTHLTLAVLALLHREGTESYFMTVGLWLMPFLTFCFLAGLAGHLAMRAKLQRGVAP